MGEVQVVDRGSREIVVFLRGDVDESMQAALDAAVEEVDSLENISMLNRVVVDMQRVTSFGPAGVSFLRALEARGQQHGFDLSLSMLSGPAHRAIEASGWMVVEGMPPLRS